MAKKIDISHRTIVFTVAFLFAAWFVFQIRDIIFKLFIAFILMSALSPTVEKLAKYKIPRMLTVISIYIFFFSFVGLVIAGIVPPLIDQTAELVSQIPTYVEQVNIPWIDKSQFTAQFSQLGSLPSQILKLSVGLFMNLINITALFVLTMYMIIDRRHWNEYAGKLFSEDKRERFLGLIGRIEKNLGRWVRMQLFLMFLIGTVSYIGLRLLEIEFCLPLAVLAGLLEIVPSVGPTLSAIPAIIAGLAVSPTKGLMVLLLYIAIQQIENDLIVPKVMQKGLQFNPLVVLVTLVVGLRLGGVGGMALAVPILVVSRELLREFLASSKKLQI
ncbi:AI-2E family transporter [Patescibacteria group bacterium]|nr:AI-2E family transporter [Patescibacteria group bacterium]